MTVSIIICTRNRAASLRSTLESIGKAMVPSGWKVELLVVDNGSTDQTAQVARNTRLLQIPSKYLSEPQVGKGHAYNTGISAAAGEVLLFTDDDVRVPTHWIEMMCLPIFNGTTDAVAGGVGFPDHHAEVLATLKSSPAAGWLASTQNLDRQTPARMVGANMAFHRRVLDRVPGFDLELGPGALGLGEETLFSYQLLIAGYRLVAVFEACVEHHFELERLTSDNLLGIARKMGRSHAFIFHHWEHKKSRLVIPRLILCHLRHFWAELLNRNNDFANKQRFGKLLTLEEELAFYREYLTQRRRSFKYALRGTVPVGDGQRPKHRALARN